MKLQSFTQAKLALGSDVLLTLVTDRPVGDVNQLFDTLWIKIFQFEQQFSRFLPSSELSAFNRAAGLKAAVSDDFRTVLSVAKSLAEQTNGLYNPFILPALQRSGYHQSQVKKYQNDKVDNYSDKNVVTHDRLVIGDEWAQIPYGTAIDLGGMGKGYLADKLAEIIPDWVSGYWLSIGGDVVGNGSDEHSKPWLVEIDSGYDEVTDWVYQNNSSKFSIATSGTTVHKWTKDGENRHHIIDPRTLKPASSDVWLSTVVAHDTVTADVLASCAVILGEEQSKQFLKSHGIDTFILQTEDVNGQKRESVVGQITRSLTRGTRKLINA